MDQIEPNLMELLLVVWKRKWQIIIPTFLLAVAAGIISFLLPVKYEVDAIIQPSKIFVQTDQGVFDEIVVVDPKQVAGQINQESYNRLIAAKMHMDIRDFPSIQAENLRDTSLVRVAIHEDDVDKGKGILNTLFDILKNDFNRKIEVEIKTIDSNITTSKNEIKKRELDIQSKEIEKAKKRQEITAAGNKLKISEERCQNITEEMKSVKQRIDGIEAQQRQVLKERVEGISAVSLLLYSSEIQQNLRYYNTLDEKLSNERVIQENLKLLIRASEEDIKLLNTDIERLKKEIEELQNLIGLMTEKKARIDYAQLIKEPTASINPVSPNKPLIVLVAGILGLVIFVALAYFLEFLKRQKEVRNLPASS
jgi:LPS O-antigen subunit length determinant protein (WzzB/FepE family)